jgi:glycosyltransferase involved in cell wall biosynthesis
MSDHPQHHSSDADGRTIAFAPKHSPANDFVNTIASITASHGYVTYDYRYDTTLPEKLSGVVFHFPNQFFLAATAAPSRLNSELLATWERAKTKDGTRFIWIAHNAKPHDTMRCDPAITRPFFRILDAIVYLSESSRQLIKQMHQPAVEHETVLRHGHYRRAHATRPLQDRPGAIRLGAFGQIRRYKNYERLLQCWPELVSQSTDVVMEITGYRPDIHYASQLELLAAACPEVTLDFRPEVLPLSEIESAIDRCHGIVLAYSDILNSGSALHALSRNRPILAPRLGSLPDLQRDVGTDWVHLYEGELKASHLSDFVDHLRNRTSQMCDLSLYDWSLIGPQWCQFLSAVIAG